MQVNVFRVFEFTTYAMVHVEKWTGVVMNGRNFGVSCTVFGKVFWLCGHVEKNRLELNKGITVKGVRDVGTRR